MRNLYTIENRRALVITTLLHFLAHPDLTKSLQKQCPQPGGTSKGLFLGCFSVLKDYASRMRKGIMCDSYQSPLNNPPNLSEVRSIHPQDLQVF
jgi:hypothetical protein